MKKTIKIPFCYLNLYFIAWTIKENKILLKISFFLHTLY